MLNNRFMIHYYMIVATLSSNVTRGIFVLFLLSVGLSDTEIGSLQTILFIGTMLFEIPSGYLADRYGRKYALALSFAFSVIYGIGSLVFSHFYPFVILFFIHGLTYAFQSGADQALLYDYLKAKKRNHLFIKINGRAKAISAISMSLSLALGGWIQESISWNMVYIVFVITKIVGMCLVLLLDEKKHLVSHETVPPQQSKDDNNKENYSEKIKLVQFFRGNNKHLLWVFISFALFESVLTPYYIYGQKLLNEATVSILIIGLLYSLIELINSLLYLLADKVSQRINFMMLLILTFMLISIFLFITPLIPNKIALCVLFVITLCTPAFFDLSYSDYINQYFPTSIRATCISIESFINATFLALSYLIFGYGFDTIGIKSTIQISALVVLISMGIAIVALNVSARSGGNRA